VRVKKFSPGQHRYRSFEQATAVLEPGWEWGKSRIESIDMPAGLG
jgi:hypothetical protein